jgi:hypothetical protein
MGLLGIEHFPEDHRRVEPLERVVGEHVMGSGKLLEEQSEGEVVGGAIFE